MFFAYLTEQGSKIVRRRGRLCVCRKGETLAELIPSRVQGLWLFGRVHLTLQACETLLRTGVPVAMLSLRGALKGFLWPARQRLHLARCQHLRAEDPTARLELARILVQAKILNARACLQRFAYNHPESGIRDAIGELKNRAEAALRQRHIDSLRGIEGSAGRIYFAALKVMCRAEIDFPGRRLRPPPDPLNAMLSFGYTLLGTEICNALYAATLDPYCGFYHADRAGRPALALDLLEEFRHPVVDRLCLYLANNRILKVDDFQTTVRRGVRFKPDALKRFLGHYERTMKEPLPGVAACPRALIARQTGRFAEWLRSGKSYKPFLYPARREDS